MKKIFSIYYYIPVLLYTIFLLFMGIPRGITYITFNMLIFLGILLIIAIMFSIKNGYVNLIGFILLIVNTIYGLIIGNQEYISYCTFYIALVLDIFYVIIYFLDRLFFREKTLLLKNK